jgi:hypothetical protein
VIPSTRAIENERVRLDSSPRARLVATLTETIAAATGAGDLHAARVAHEALGRLLATPDPDVAEVTDIGAERARRKGDR